MQTRHVFVTGALRGIGRAMALSYAKAGASMIAIGSDTDLSEVTAAVEAAARAASRAPPKVVPVYIDPQDEKSIAGAVSVLRQEFEGRLDVLVNNAGFLETSRPIDESQGADWGRSWEINVRGPHLVTRAFVPLLLERADSTKTVVNVSSIGAQIITPAGSAYQTARFAMVRLTEYMNAEYGRRGLVVFCMYPGAVKSELGSDIAKELEEKLIDTPELMADTNTFLTQERRGWLAGRYLSATWDMAEFSARSDEIVATDRLKMRSLG